MDMVIKITSRIVYATFVVAYGLAMLAISKQMSQNRDDARWAAMQARNDAWLEKAQARCDKINAANGVHA